MSTAYAYIQTFFKQWWMGTEQVSLTSLTLCFGGMCKTKQKRDTVSSDWQTVWHQCHPQVLLSDFRWMAVISWALLIFSRFLWAFELSHQEWLYVFSHSSHIPLCNVFWIFSQQKVKAIAFYPWIWACPLVTCLLLIRNLQTWCRGFKRTVCLGFAFLLLLKSFWHVN